jgi:hypothetical protein
MVFCHPGVIKVSGYYKMGEELIFLSLNYKTGIHQYHIPAL